MSTLFFPMASWFPDLGMQRLQLFAVAASIFLLLTAILAVTLLKFSSYKDTLESFQNFGKFFYVSFLKPHTGDGLGGQQGALESFYKAQVREGLSTANLR